MARLLAGLDGVRHATLSLVGPLAPGLLRDREWRVGVYGVLGVVIAFALTALTPLGLLAIGPLVLGVPHLAADVRYLVARPGLHRRPELWLFVFLPATLAFLHPHAWVSLLAITGAALVAKAAPWRRGLVGVLGLGLVGAAAALGRNADLALAHLHNVVAVVLFCLWSRRRGYLAFVGLVPFVLGLVAIASGVLDGPSARALLAMTPIDGEELVRSLSPVDDPTWSARITLAFAFAQSVHYAVWLRLVPEEDRPRPGLRGFQSSVRALAGDLGWPLLLVVSVASVAIALAGLVSVAAARDGYLRLAIVHGPLELGAATLLLLEHGRLGVRGWDKPRPC